jgi:predicted transcriptional regulator
MVKFNSNYYRKKLEALMLLITTTAELNTLRKEALSAWIDYQATGLHLTGKEVQDWLATWGTPEEYEIPQCHN